MLNRRSFLGAAAALPYALRSMAQGVHAPHWVFLGTDKGKGIYRAKWDAGTGTIGQPELAVETERPDFFALHPKLPVLYTVNSVAGPKAAVSAYKFSREDASLTLLNRVSSEGDGPCYVSVDATGSVLYVANYTGGSFTGYELKADGSMNKSSLAMDCHKMATMCGPVGPVKERQDSAHLHCTVISPDGEYVLVCDLGDDTIQIYPIIRGNLTTFDGPAMVRTRAGSGPRHVAFHPNGRWLYCIHEIDCTVDLYEWSVTDSKPVLKLREDSVVSTLAKSGALKGNTACEIFVSRDGRFVYTCTRGVDEILVFAVDTKTGLLSEHQRVKCGGPIPRYIALDPSGKWLVSCNQGSAAQPVGNLTVFGLDAKSGRISETPRVVSAETPMFISWV